MPASTLSELYHSTEFVSRHIGPQEGDLAQQLNRVKADSLEGLIAETVPADIRCALPEAFPEALSEQAALERLKQLASKNEVVRTFIGMGYHPVHVPPVIQRNVLENPAWYTAYTPYQPEISQGRLEALLHFQQVCLDLTGLDLAGASLLDEATAAAEAMSLCLRQFKKKTTPYFFVDQSCHPQVIDVLQGRADALGIDLQVGDEGLLFSREDWFGAIVPLVDTWGEIRNLSLMAEHLHQNKALLCIDADPMAMVRVMSPAQMGADVAFGSMQRFGVPMGFGGPHAAYLVTSKKYQRSMPGRVIGLSKDRLDQPALRMAMQTREQHIRREKATSNICTAQVLLANMSAFYALYHGNEGVSRIAERIQRLTDMLALIIADEKQRPINDTWFDTLTFDFEHTEVSACMHRALEVNVNVRGEADRVSVSLSEVTQPEDLIDLFYVITGKRTDSQKLQDADYRVRHDGSLTGLPKSLARSGDALSHPAFQQHRSEAEMVRYIRRLEEKDLSLVHGMIPLGSCTMKLNAVSEMMPVSWPEFAHLHPFAPPNQSAGYQVMLDELIRYLAEITGLPSVSLQPNSGAQGEYAGLMAIRGYLDSLGQKDRTVCLIPKSAHGTNPASAVIAGFSVEIVRCDEFGNIDLEHLTEKAEALSDRLGCLMITYPSTHGVYETHVRDVCDVIHQHGGQVYMDGANLNAQVGLTTPASIGADVTHINLHKTFCIPHGGGGPGMGPITGAAHLAPFMPGHAVVSGTCGVERDQGAVSAAPFGSASILVISWMYITMMGREGLMQASKIAILNANYLADSLKEDYDVLFTGENGRVAHECILDLRPLKAEAGITEEDIAKRLMDYGFHAPTMSFPVAGTLMIEPTESEPVHELDRFVFAMKSIRQEVRQVAEGVWPRDNNPLVNAPHTQKDLQEEWAFPYSQALACWPSPASQAWKFWPSVNRVDSVYGDRNLICSCPTPESYEE